jgi:hypothetical protein
VTEERKCKKEQRKNQRQEGIIGTKQERWKDGRNM